ncbi:hypothetical protein K457DRAFT_13410 [Linnemannia elongata AG-77]|uniref:Transmembrane protein n=1 Tax=Linnemannia elongata AG-77 TaxID=1314771 RepID=A0A197KCR6_9FUNG|nr:hypothetical protein K457DRAFT_13410 [Linnemannia elongata AG-77]
MAGLVHVSRRTLHHAHSIRLIKQAGLLEMVRALWYSSVNRPWFGLLATLNGGYMLMGILVSVKIFGINPSTGERGLSHDVVGSRQFIVVNSLTRLPAWSIPVSFSTSVEDALARALNSTTAIPRVDPKKRYRPRLSEYEPACDQLDFKLTANVGNESLLLPNAGCATLIFSPPHSMHTNLTGSYIVQESKTRAKMVIPGTDDVTKLFNGTVVEVTLTVLLKFPDQEHCLTDFITPKILLATRNGLSSPPFTVVTRCQLLSGEIANLAVSGVRFSVPEPKKFHDIATSLFGTQDELVTSMESSVNNGTLISQSTDRYSQVLVMEVKVMGTEVSALMCVGSKLDGEPRIVCVYAVAHSTITKPRPSNPDITQLFPKGISSITTPGSVMMSLSHLPAVGMSTPTFAIPKILNSSSIASAYFASLGQNYIMDWEGSMLYIAYDTVEVIKGYEIPAGLFYLLIGVMFVCFLFCAATEYRVEDQYKRSLYWQVAQSLATSQDKASPQLHRFDIKQLEFEGRRIVSTKLPRMSKETPIYQQPVPDSKVPLLTDK